MPELPEVETVRRCLDAAITGARIRSAEVRRERMARRQPNPADIPSRLEGRVVSAVGRHGKFLRITVDDDFVWVLHLGMSGRIELVDPVEPETRHTNVVVRFDGSELRFVDPRTFGFVAVYTEEELAASSLASLGPDALTDLPAARDLARRLAGRTAPIKALLLDQRLLAGLGNIYADEVLHRAHVRPGRPGGSLDPGEVAAIRRSIRPVLKAGIAAGGTSLTDLAYLLPDGRAGEFTVQLRVYGRAGAPCRRCGSAIERSMIAQRSSHFCPTCQV